MRFKLLLDPGEYSRHSACPLLVDSPQTMMVIRFRNERKLASHIEQKQYGRARRRIPQGLDKMILCYDASIGSDMRRKRIRHRSDLSKRLFARKMPKRVSFNLPDALPCNLVFFPYRLKRLSLPSPKSKTLLNNIAHPF